LSDEESLRWIAKIVREELDDETIVLSMETTPADIPGWDSLAHVGIILAVERGRGAKLTTEQIEGLQNVGDLVRLAHGAEGR
jgi:acyl carrier protein